MTRLVHFFTKFGAVLCISTACAAPVVQAPIPQIVEVTRLVTITNNPTSTPIVVEKIVTVQVEVTRLVSPTPTTSQTCMQSAITSYDFSVCKKQEIELLTKQLAIIIDHILIDNPMDKVEFLNYQKQWEALMINECFFYYRNQGSIGRSINAPNCIVSRLNERIKELRLVYFTSPPQYDYGPPLEQFIVNLQKTPVPKK